MKKELQGTSMQEMEETPMIAVLPAAQLLGMQTLHNVNVYTSQHNLTPGILAQWYPPPSVEFHRIEAHAACRRTSSHFRTSRCEGAA